MSFDERQQLNHIIHIGFIMDSCGGREMHRKLSSMIWVCCFLLFSGHAHAILITDRWLGDQNTIAGSFQDDINHIFHWEEDYNEDNLVPYPSANGYAVVNAPGDPGCPAGTEVCYFDKVLTLEGEVGIWEFQIGVFNTSPFDWSDYHFEFYDPLFQQPLDNALLDVQNGIFPVIEVMPNAVWLSGGTQYSGPAYLQNLITVTADLDPFVGVGSIGIRQVATTPEPTTLALLSLGLAGLGFTRRKMMV